MEVTTNNDTAYPQTTPPDLPAESFEEYLPESPASPDSPHHPTPVLPASPALSSSSGPTRPKTILGRFSFNNSKGIKELAIQDLEKRRGTERSEAKAREEALSREQRVRHDQEKKDRAEERRASKERAKQEKAEKQERRATEKRVKSFYGIRGFDPNAGNIHGPAEVAAIRAPELSEPRSRTGQTWGLEFGKPKHHDGKGHFSGNHEACGEHHSGGTAASCPSCGGKKSA